MKNYNSPNIYIVAGEPSGDILGDQLIKSLVSKFNSTTFNGFFLSIQYFFYIFRAIKDISVDITLPKY